MASRLEYTESEKKKTIKLEKNGIVDAPVLIYGELDLEGNCKAGGNWKNIYNNEVYEDVYVQDFYKWESLFIFNHILISSFSPVLIF